MWWDRVKARVFQRSGLEQDRRWVLVGLMVFLWLVGGPLGRLVAVCLTPRLIPPGAGTGARDRWTPHHDLLLAGVLGVTVGLAAHLLWAPSLVTGGETLASDTGEHFWMLHSLGNPGWQFWSINRYPLPTLLARPFAWGDATPHTCWYRAAIFYTGVTAGGLYLWGRAVGGRNAGLAAAILVGAFPDLVLMSRTVTAYPEMVALWTLGAATCAGAVRFPNPITFLAAGLGTAAVFASDARGLVPGLVLLACAFLAALTSRGWRRKVGHLALFAAPVAASWIAYHHLPIQVRSLEEMVEASIEVSYTRMGRRPPPRVFVEGGYRWGHAGPADIVRSLRALIAARSRLNPDIARDPRQVQLVERRVFPYLLSVALLALAGLLLGGGHQEGIQGTTGKNRGGGTTADTSPPHNLSTPGPNAARHRRLVPSLDRTRAWFDWRGKLALTPVVGFLAILANVVTFEYSIRYAALGAPALVLLAGLGVAALGGRNRPAWATVLVTVAVLYLAPGPLNVRAPWRTPAATSEELRDCLEIAAGRSNKAPVGPVKTCVEAQSRRIDRPVAWPYR